MEPEITGTSKPVKLSASSSKNAELGDPDVAMQDGSNAGTDASIGNTIEQPTVLLGEDEDDEFVDRCSICLNTFQDRAVLPTCTHDFCFECIVIWTEQSRKCPLCARNMGEHIVHRIRGPADFQRFFLPPLRSSPPPPRPNDQLNSASSRSGNNAARRRGSQVRARIEREWGRREDVQRELDELDRAVEKRRWVYHHGLYAKHVASNPHTRYRPYPTPSQFISSDELQKRATAWLRRELRVFPGLEIEWLTQFVLSLMSSLDIRSEGAVKLLAEFLDMDKPSWDNANHFAHELYSYMRSPYRDLFVYDSVVQYDVPADLPPPYVPPARSSHWRPHSRPQTQSRSRSSSPESRLEHHGHRKSGARHTGAGASTSHHHSRSVRIRNDYDEDENMEPHQSPRDLCSPSPRRRSVESRSPSHDRYEHERRKGRHRAKNHTHPSRGRSRSRERTSSKGKGKARANSISPRSLGSSSSRERSRPRHRSPSYPKLSRSRSPESQEISQAAPLSSGIRIHGAAKQGKINTGASTAPGSKAYTSLPDTSPPILRIRGAAQASVESPTPPPLTPSEGASTPQIEASTLPTSAPRSRQVGLPRSLKSSITAHLSATTLGTGAPRKRLGDRISGADAVLLHETRARVADRRGEAVAGVQPHMTSLETAEQEETSVSSSTGLNGGAGTAGEVAGKEVNGLRQALLNRLERERLAAVAPAESSNAPHGETKPNRGAKKNKNQDLDITADNDKETQLRQQAHLRARLARAKQEAGTPVDLAFSESQSTGGNGDHHGKEHNVNLDAVEQEAKLRLKLSRTRRSKV